MKITIFAVMAFETALMTINSEMVFMPIPTQEMNPTIRKVFIVYYYYVLYAPLFFGIPRYDFIGFVISLTYSWTFLINIIGSGLESISDAEGQCSALKCNVKPRKCAIMIVNRKLMFIYS